MKRYTDDADDNRNRILAWGDECDDAIRNLCHALDAAGIAHTSTDYRNDCGPSVGVTVDGIDVWRAMACVDEETDDRVTLSAWVNDPARAGEQLGAIDTTDIDAVVAFLRSTL